MSIIVEVSAYYHTDPVNVDTCNDDPARADGFGVYVKNPRALHLRDFTVLDVHAANVAFNPYICRAEARRAAIKWAKALSDHLDCELDIRCLEIDELPSQKS